MCGIGLVLSPSDDRVSRVTATLCHAMAHRGPDGQGVYKRTTALGTTLGLGHRRLSILDLSALGNQPMVDKQTNNAIIFNGEIYNFQQIKAELLARGETFDSSSDTEVLLKAYRYFEPAELLRKLRGMFAFAIWDHAKQKILLARDPCGIKPLYYVSQPQLFACASEARALVKAGLVDGGIDAAGLDSLLAFGSVQDPLTIFKGVRALLPGHMLWVEGDAEISPPEPYWHWHPPNPDASLGSIREALETSVCRHLVSDVPVGLFLSSGFDSSALAAVASKVGENSLNTFTLGFPSVPAMCEAENAARIAKHLGTDHHIIEFSQADLTEQASTFFQQMDQPSDDGLNVHLISRSVSQAGIKTCLHGVGGDELFGGYPSFTQVPMAMRLKLIPNSVRHLLAGLIDGGSIARQKLSQALRSDLSLLSTFLTRRGVFSFAQRRDLLGSSPPLGESAIPEAWIKQLHNQLEFMPDVFSAISLLETAHYAGNKLLRDGDVMSMAHGLELRFPLLDVDLIRAALWTPASQKRARGGFANKPALTSAIDDFPFALINKQKRGFTVPLKLWIQDKLGQDIKAVLNDLPDKIGLDENAVKAEMARSQSAGGGQAWLRVWLLYSLGCWLRANNY